jgi:Tfp pilus assembly protein PilF
MIWNVSRRPLIAAILLALLSGCSAARSPQPTADERRTVTELIDQGVVYMRAGALDRAEASFHASYEVLPQAAAIDGLGCVAFLRRDFVRSEELFRQALAMDPQYHRALGNLAMVHEVTNRRESALQLYRRAIELEPKNVAARNNFAGLLYDYGLGDGKGYAGARQRARGELLKAQAVTNHPIIKSGLETLE